MYITPPPHACLLFYQLGPMPRHTSFYVKTPFCPHSASYSCLRCIFNDRTLKYFFGLSPWWDIHTLYSYPCWDVHTFYLNCPCWHIHFFPHDVLHAERYRTHVYLTVSHDCVTWLSVTWLIVCHITEHNTSKLIQKAWVKQPSKIWESHKYLQRLMNR